MKKGIIDSIADFNNFYEMLTALPDDTACRIYLEKILWNNTPTCYHCKAQGHYEVKQKGMFKGLYKCKDCKQRYTVAQGTIFEGSHIGYRKWFIAIFLFQAHKKGISSLQLHRDLGLTQKTTWFMLHRIRTAMGVEPETQLEGTIELDESFVGGKNKNRHHDKKVEQSQGRSFKDKTPVMGMLQEAVKEVIERPHKTHPFMVVKETIYHKEAIVKCVVVPDTKGASLKPIIKKYVKEGSVLVSDEWQGYNGLNAKYDHRIVDHRAKQYVNENGDTSNAIEGFWTWLKRSNMGVYHVMSRKHMQAYANENSFRYNNHRMKDKPRFDLTLQQANGLRLTYKQLIGSNK